MRISDWSSDVCSSDLMTFLPMVARLQVEPGDILVESSWLVVAVATLPSPWLWNRLGALLGDTLALRFSYVTQLAGVLAALLLPAIGRASCRERVCQYV